MGTLRNSEVMDFTGGINTVVAPHLIAKQEALHLVNVDIDFGSLKSVPNAELVQPIAGSHFVEFRGKIYSYNGWRSNTRQDNNLYWSDGTTLGKILWDGRELPLGMVTPTTIPTLAAGSAGPHLGDFKYTYTFYSTDTGVESAPCSLTDYFTAASTDIVISGMQTLPPEADRYRLYRIGGYLPRFTMVAELEVDTYTDSLDDTQIDGRLLQTMRSGLPIQGTTNLTELNGRLFGSVGSKVYFSALGNADAWYASDFFTLPSDIIGIASSPAGLIILGDQFVYTLAGSNPSNFRLKVVSNHIGCISAASIAYIKGAAIWLSETGICLSNGYDVENLTANKIEAIKNRNVTSSTVINNVYYLHFELSTEYPDNNIVVMDFKRGNKYSFHYLQYENMDSIGNVSDVLHLSSGIDDLIFLDCDKPLLCSDFLLCSEYSINKIGDGIENKLAKLVYVSPQFVDGTIGTLKEYDKVRINFRGAFKVKVIFSDLEVAVEANISTIAKTVVYENIEYTEDRGVIIGIPNNNNTSYSISFVIEGIGSIKSIQYSWKPRELP